MCFAFVFSFLTIEKRTLRIPRDSWLFSVTHLRKIPYNSWIQLPFPTMKFMLKFISMRYFKHRAFTRQFGLCPHKCTNPIRQLSN